MKKIIIAVLLIALLTGCSGANAKLSDGNEVIFKTNDKTFTKADLYEAMKSNDYSSIIITKLIDAIAEIEEINLDEVKKEVETSYDEMVEQGYESYIAYYYGGKDTYISQMLSSAILEKLTESYADNNYEDLKKEFAPFKAQIAYFDDEETANKVLEAAKANEKTFEMLVSENGSSSDATEQIYTDNSDLPVEVKEAISKMNEAGYSDVIKSTTYQTSTTTDTTAQTDQTVETNKYYVVNLVNKDVDSFKDEFVELLKTSLLDSTKVINFYLAKHDFKVYDQKTYDLLSKTYEVK